MAEVVGDLPIELFQGFEHGFGGGGLARLLQVELVFSERSVENLPHRLHVSILPAQV